MEGRTTQLQAEKDNRRKSSILTAVLAILFFILAFIPIFGHIKIEESGISVLLGSPDMIAKGDKTLPSSSPVVEEQTADIPPPPEENTPPPPPVEEPTPSSTKKAHTADNDNVSLNKKKEPKKKTDSKKKKDSEKKAKEKAREEARKKAAAKKKAEAEKKRKAEQKAREQFSDFLGGGDGGEDDSPTGSEDGTLDGESSQGIPSSSFGEIGGGLKGRKVLRKPNIKDNSQATGKVVVKVCVDKNGKVISSEYTQKGSTATDKGLIDKAVEGVKGYKFEPDSSHRDKVCGTISVTFKVR